MKIIVQHSGSRVPPQRHPGSVSYELHKKSRGDSRSVLKHIEDASAHDYQGVKSQDLAPPFSGAGKRRNPSKKHDNDDLNALMRINKLQRAEVRSQASAA